MDAHNSKQAKKMAAAALAGCGSKSGGEPLTKEVRRLAFVEAPCPLMAQSGHELSRTPVVGANAAYVYVRAIPSPQMFILKLRRQTPDLLQSNQEVTKCVCH